VARHVGADQDSQVNALAQARLNMQGSRRQSEAPGRFVRFGLMTRSVLNFALLEPRGAPVGDPDPLNEQTRCAMSGESPRQAVHSRAVAKLDPGRRRGRSATAIRAAGFLRTGALGFANTRLHSRLHGRRDGIR